MRKRLSGFILLLCLVVILSGCGKEIESQEDSPETTQEIQFYTTDVDCFAIETRYGALEYPEKWEKITKTEIVDDDYYTVKFYAVSSAGDIPLFDISFNSGEGLLLGTLPIDGKKIPVYLDSFEISKDTMSEEEYTNCCAMEEDVNVIISRLIEKNGLVLSVNEVTSEQAEDVSAYSIETKYGNLSYPEKWKDLAKTEIVDSPIYTVKFSAKTSVGDVPLFDLTFNGSDGYCLGQMHIDGQAVTIYIVDYTLDKESMSEKEYLDCCAMRNDVNVILEHLSDDYGFSF